MNKEILRKRFEPVSPKINCIICILIEHCTKITFPSNFAFQQISHKLILEWHYTQTRNLYCFYI